MMSLKGKVIKHERAMDIMFDVWHVSYAGPNYLKIKGVWLNMGFGPDVGLNFIVPANGKYGPITSHITLKREDLKNWKFAANRNAPNLRYGKWLSL